MNEQQFIECLRGDGMCFKRLWVDDERPIPKNYSEEWTRAHSFHEAIMKLELMDICEVSLDHDIASFYGYTEMNGVHIVQWMIQRKMDGYEVPSIIHVHSANPIGADNMRKLIERYL